MKLTGYTNVCITRSECMGKTFQAATTKTREPFGHR